MDVNKITLEETMNRQAVELGAYVMTIRHQQGISQVQFAKAMGVSRPTLQRLESGNTSVGLGVCLKALNILGVEQNIWYDNAPLYQPLPSMSRKKKISFANKLSKQNIHPRMAKNAAWLLVFSPEKRIHVLSRAVRKWQRTSLQTVKNMLQTIEKQHGRAMLIGDAAMFLYGKPNRTLDYEFWVRIADDELTEIITAFGFDIERNRNGVLVAYDESCKLSFLLSKRVYTQDQPLIEYDNVEGTAKAISFEDYKFLIPNINNMLKFNKRGDDHSSKDLEDIAYLFSSELFWFQL